MFKKKKKATGNLQYTFCAQKYMPILYKERLISLIKHCLHVWCLDYMYNFCFITISASSKQNNLRYVV